MQNKAKNKKKTLWCNEVHGRREQPSQRGEGGLMGGLE